MQNNKVQQNNKMNLQFNENKFQIVQTVSSIKNFKQNNCNERIYKIQ